jgi:hypothetical protein
MRTVTFIFAQKGKKQIESLILHHKPFPVRESIGFGTQPLWLWTEINL